MVRNRRPRAQLTLAATTLAGLVLSMTASRAERIPGFCSGFVHPGPTQVTCNFTYQGRSLFAFAVVANTSIGRNPTLFGNIFTFNPAFVVVEILRADDPTFPVAQCSFNGDIVDTIPPLFVGLCIGPEQPTLADNTPLICRARGRIYALFGCLSNPDLDPIDRPPLPQEPL